MGALEIRNAYGAVAELYISMFGSADQTHDDDLSLIRRHLGHISGPVLDLGCGPGHLSGFLRDLDVDVMGVDLVPQFVSHARTARPDISFSVGTLQTLGRPDHFWGGILAWYSLIHVPPADLDGVLADVRRALADDGVLVTGCFAADQVGAFDHKVLTAYRWPVDEFVRRLTRAGFVELERIERPADGDIRPHAAIALQAS